MCCHGGGDPVGVDSAEDGAAALLETWEGICGSDSKVRGQGMMREGTQTGRDAETVKGRWVQPSMGVPGSGPDGEAPHSTFICSPALHTGASSVPELPGLMKLYCAMEGESDRRGGWNSVWGQGTGFYNPGKWWRSAEAAWTPQNTAGSSAGSGLAQLLPSTRSEDEAKFTLRVRGMQLRRVLLVYLCQWQ